MRDFDKSHELNLLYDFYGSLLTVKQQRYFNLYLIEDLTLREIADQLSVSHNAVADAINKIIKTLNNYEKKLNLYAKDLQRKSLYKKYEDKNSKELIKQLKEIE